MPNSIQELLNKGETAKAKALCEKALIREPENPRLIHLSAMIDYIGRDYTSAKTKLDSIQDEQGKDPQYLINYGLIEFARKDFANAIKSIKKAIKLDKTCISAYINLGYFYLQQKSYQLAIDTYEAGIAQITPSTNKKNAAALHYNLAVTCSEAGLTLAAIKAYKQALEYVPQHQGALLNLGEICKIRQDFEESKALLQKLLDTNPHHIKALYLLSETPLTQDECNKYIQALESIESKLTGEEKIRVQFTLGNLYHKTKNYPNAWDAYYQANQQVARSQPFKLSGFTDECEKIKQYYQEMPLDKLPKGTDSSEPIFIIGLPRSGKSLCEKLLRHHEDIAGIGEGIFFIQQIEAWKKSSNQNLPMVFKAFDNDKLKKMGASYLEYCHKKTGLDSIYTIDTMPYHGVFMGFLYQVFPKAKFIVVHREKRDTLCEIYFKWFKFGHEYAYKLSWCQEFIDTYHNMLNFWQTLLPDNNQHHVNYEDLVLDTQNSLNKITAFLNLPADRNPNWLPPGMHLSKDEINVHQHYKKWLETEL